MHAAKVLFEKEGIDNVTFNDIAKEADMCRTTIFNHFATINDLMLALAEQEMIDITNHCSATGLKGRALIMDMFNMLLIDTANYPALTSRLTSNSIINAAEKRSIARLEDIIRNNLGDLTKAEKEKKVILLTGAYYGIVNHYFINDLEFDPAKMKRQFAKLAAEII